MKEERKKIIFTIDKKLKKVLVGMRKKRKVKTVEEPRLRVGGVDSTEFPNTLSKYRHTIEENIKLPNL